jgi:NADP-dependent 3-hydroxy acid dehydrogenase YdfG
MNTPLANKIAVITGASAGIGRATAMELARQGAAVVLQARRAERLDAVAAEIRASGGKALSVKGDASKEQDIERLLARAQEFSEALSSKGRLDIVVVNAGRGLAGGLLTSDTTQWESMYAVNVLGAAHLMRRAGLLMAAQQAGDIVVLASVAGRNVSPFSGFYGSTKFALAAMAEAFRREICPKKVRVTTILPGIVESEFQQVAGYTQDNFYRNIERYGKLLDPQDVARMVSFVVAQPPHVHVNEIMIRPTSQDYP